MKFTGVRSERQRRSQSVDVIGRPEEEAESEFFDPRVDFPAEELARLKQLALDLEARTKEGAAIQDLRSSWWLGLVDQEYNQLLHADPKFSDTLLQRFRGYFEAVAGDPRRGPTGAMKQAIPAIQLYPGLRNPIRKEFFDALLPGFLRKPPKAPELLDAAITLRSSLVLYPERRTEWLDVLSIQPEEVVARLQNALKGNLFPENKATITSSLLLSFPGLRPEILKTVSGQKEWIHAFKSARLPFEHHDHELAFDLTVIGAESARIDEQGQIQLELKPRPVQRGQHELPARSML